MTIFSGNVQTHSAGSTYTTHGLYFLLRIVIFLYLYLGLHNFFWTSLSLPNNNWHLMHSLVSVILCLYIPGHRE